MSLYKGDTVIGRNHKDAIVTLVERKTGDALSRKVKTKHADGVAAAIIDALKPLKTLVRIITFDNRLEFAQHERITAALNAKVYFVDPYSSWQRGTNKNWNGLLRQYNPKKCCSSGLKHEHLLAATSTLNTRTRKRLDWRTPYEALSPSAKRAGAALAA